MLCAVLLGVWYGAIAQASPPFVFPETSVEKTRWQIIADIRNTPNTFDVEHQRLLWTLFWESRLGIIDEDPDIFERVLDHQITAATHHPTESTKVFTEIQTAVLLHSAIAVLNRDYAIPKELWNQETVESIQQSILVEMSPYTNPSALEQWLPCWKSSGGSVGMELYRLAIRELTAVLDSSVTTTNSIHSDFGLANPVQIACPQYKPAQVESQGIPKQPQPKIVHFTQSTYDIWFPSIVRWFTLLSTLAILTWLKQSYPKYKRLWLRVTTPVLLLLGVEYGSGLCTTPLLYTKPLFHTQKWEVVPWIIDKQNEYFQTQGSYLRSQKISRTTSRPRVVILGASSAHGSNELWEDTFAGHLAAEDKWDVVNLGIGGTTSAGLVSLLPYIQELQPDALIIYYGHNEVHQLRQLSNISPTFMQWYPLQRLLWSSNLYTQLHSFVKPTESIQFEPHPTQEDTTLPSPTEEQFMFFSTSHFENNISLVLHNTHDIPTLLITPPTNYPFAPMEYSVSLPKTIDEIQQQIDVHPEATTIHSTIKAAIPKLATKHGTYHWDLDEYFHQNSPDTTSANGLFWDELHPSALGHKWIADGLHTWLQDVEPLNTER